MGYSNQIASRWIGYLDGQGYNYDFDREKGIIRLNFSINSSLNRVKCIVDLHDSCFITYGGIDLSAQEDKRKEVAEYLTRANYGLRFGNFELDMRDGEIRYKCAVDCENCMPSNEIIERSLDIPVVMYQRYGDNLLKVMFGMTSAEEAIRLAESDTN